MVRPSWRQGASSTGIQDVVTATGLNRSSRYAAFGGKQNLYRAALRRYVERHSQPAFRRLAVDVRGLPALTDHQQLRDAVHSSPPLVTVEARGQLGPDTDLGAAADLLALLAYGVNRRSQAGADARTLSGSVTAALSSTGGPGGALRGEPVSAGPCAPPPP